MVMKTSLYYHTYDNITCIIICFRNLRRIFFEHSNKEEFYNSIINSIKSEFPYKEDEKIIFDNDKLGVSKNKGENSDSEESDLKDLYRISHNKKTNNDLTGNFLSGGNKPEMSITMKTLSNLPSFKIDSKFSSLDALSKEQGKRNVNNVRLNLSNVNNLGSYIQNQKNLVGSKNINVNLSTTSNTSLSSFTSFSKEMSNRSPLPNSNTNFKTTPPPSNYKSRK
jgi:hypothetical protein